MLGRLKKILSFKHFLSTPVDKTFKILLSSFDPLFCSELPGEFFAHFWQILRGKENQQTFSCADKRFLTVDMQKFLKINKMQEEEAIWEHFFTVPLFGDYLIVFFLEYTVFFPGNTVFFTQQYNFNDALLVLVVI